jgi:hypothetical protein
VPALAGLRRAHRLKPGRQLFIRGAPGEGGKRRVESTRARDSLHLGSAIVHRQPGGSLCIVPVHAQRRGRLFLPFADDNPRWAEVISKVLLLARDHEIQDPTILEQLR